MNLMQAAIGQLFSQETELEPSMRTRVLEIGYFARADMCHANGGSAVSLDLPLVLVPEASDIPPPLEIQPLMSIFGRDMQASAEHDDVDLDIKTQHTSSRVSSVEDRQSKQRATRSFQATFCLMPMTSEQQRQRVDYKPLRLPKHDMFIDVREES